MSLFAVKVWITVESATADEAEAEVDGALDYVWNDVRMIIGGPEPTHYAIEGEGSTYNLDGEDY